MTTNLENMFNDMTDVELEKWLIECGISYEKVEKGKGGVFIDGVNIRNLDIL